MRNRPKAAARRRTGLVFIALMAVAGVGCEPGPPTQQAPERAPGAPMFAPETKRAPQVVGTRAEPPPPDVPKLLSENGCLTCHDASERRLGPPWQEVARLHGSRRVAMAEVLAQKIIRGGGGNWGLAPMVPNDHVAPEDARAMAEWILEQGPPGKG